MYRSKNAEDTCRQTEKEIFPYETPPRQRVLIMEPSSHPQAATTSELAITGGDSVHFQAGSPELLPVTSRGLVHGLRGLNRLSRRLDG